MSELTSLTLKDALAGLKARAFSSEEITRAHLGAIASARALNAFVLETPEIAIAMARAADERLARGDGQALEALRSASRTSSAPRASDQPPARASWAISRRPMNPP